MVKVLSVFSKLENLTLPSTHILVNKENLQELPSYGLCNQLFHVINIMCDCYPATNEIFFYSFCTDANKKTFSNLNAILNIAKIREKEEWKIYDVSEITDFNIENYFIYPIDYVFFSYDKNPECFSVIAKKLIFTDRFEKFSNYVIENFGLNSLEVNLVHLRIDKDMEDHIVKKHSKNIFNDFIKKYKKIIYNNCNKSTPLVLLLEDVNHPCVEELQNNYNVIFFNKEIIKDLWKKMYNEDLNGRELFALIDLLIGKNLNINIFICFDNNLFKSSFSILLKELCNYNKVYKV